MSRQSSLYSIILALHPMPVNPASADEEATQTHSASLDSRIRDLSIVWTDYHGEKELGEEGQIVTVVDKHSLSTSPSVNNKDLDPHSPIRNKPHRSTSASSTSASSIYELDPPPSLRQTSGITELGPGIIHLYKHARPLSLLESLEADAISTSASSPSKPIGKPSIEHVEDANFDVDGDDKTEESGTKTDGADGADGTLIAILAVPTWMGTEEFRDWLGGWSGCLEGFRMISDESPNKTIVLLKFKEPQEANDFMSIYTGKTFSSDLNQPETCHPIRIHHLIMHRLPPLTLNTSTATKLPPVPKTPDKGLTPLLLGIPQRTIHELPTCPICLERMDSTVTGLITTPCSHVFKCRCLSKWGQSSCTVCRYAHRGGDRTNGTGSSRHRHRTTDGNADTSNTPFTHCQECSPTQNDPKANWICVICDYVGCSRYQRGHARDHFLRSGHAYSMEIETQRVWDYMEDNYVHRLIQTRADGKLVELPSAASLATTSTPESRRSSLMLGEQPARPHSQSRLHSSSASWSGNFGPSLSDEKKIARLEDLTLEYSYLLSAQLEQQRQHYEGELARARDDLVELRRRAAEGEGWRKRFVVEEERRKEVEKKLEKDIGDQARLVAIRKAEVASDLARKLQSDLSSEQSLTTGLLSRVSALESALSTLTETHATCPSPGIISAQTFALEKSRRDLGEEKAKNAELEEMVKDLMFSLEAREKMQEAGGGEEVGVGGDLRIVVPESVAPSPIAAHNLNDGIGEPEHGKNGSNGSGGGGDKKKKKKKR